MTCRMDTFFSSAARGNVRRIVEDVHNGVMVFMPGYQMFQDIRFHIATFSGSHGGGTLKEAYNAEGYPFYPMESVISARESIVPCIKRIYQMSELDPVTGKFVDRTPGEWIYTEACNCVSQASPQYTNDRMNLGDGFVVPGIQEKTDISALVSQKGYTFNQALNEICNDIIPPTVSCIEQGFITHPTWRWYDVYSACRTTYLRDQGLPDGNGDGETPKKDNTLVYVLVGVGVFLLLAR